jgi:simple sugar transport system substrate-binding protein
MHEEVVMKLSMLRTAARVLALAAVLALGFAPALSAQAVRPARVAVFIPGVRAGNAIYDTMARGVEKAVKGAGASDLKVFEAGFNQAEWEEKLTSLVATGLYDLVVTSNPSMPELCVKVGKSFPKQRFLVLDSYLPSSPQIHTVLYNQAEQGYVAGYLAGLVTTGKLKGSNAARRAGMVIGQHYPVMDKVIAPGFERGLKAVDPAITVDLRVVDNWYDAAKGQALAKDEIAQGADVILPVCGGAAAGVYKAAAEAGAYVVVFDDDQFALAPGTILGCAILRQEELAYARTKTALEGKLVFGQAEVVGMREGFVAFLDKAPGYVAAVPADIRAKMADLVSRIMAGKLVLEVPLKDF